MDEVIIKLVNPSSSVKQKTIEIPDLKLKNTKGTITVLKSTKPDDMNTIEKTDAIVPITNSVEVKDKKVEIQLAPWSFSVVRIKIR